VNFSVAAWPMPALMGGGFTTFNGTNCNRVARLNADGSRDTNFMRIHRGQRQSVQVVSTRRPRDVRGYFTAVGG
jgi:hypothetical protein